MNYTFALCVILSKSALLSSSVILSESAPLSTSVILSDERSEESKDPYSYSTLSWNVVLTGFSYQARLKSFH